jgi:hypothetical protein
LDSNLIVWDNFIENQRIKIKEQKENCIIKINQLIQNIKDIFQNIRITISDLKEKFYDKLISHTSAIYFFWDFLNKNYNNDNIEVNGQNFNKVYLINNERGELLRIIDPNIDPNDNNILLLNTNAGQAQDRFIQDSIIQVIQDLIIDNLLIPQDNFNILIQLNGSIDDDNKQKMLKYITA